MVAAASVYFLMFFSIGIYVIYLPTWLEIEVHVSGTDIASLFFVGGLSNVIFGPLAGRLSDKIGRKPLIVTSCVGLSAVMFATTYAVAGIQTAYLFFALAMIMFALRISPLQSLLSALVNSERRGLLLSFAVAIGQMGIFFGSGMAGFSYTNFGFISNTMIGAIAMIGMALLVHFYLPEPDGQLETDTADIAKATA